jgi:activator of HSP90 ATPase
LPALEDQVGADRHDSGTVGEGIHGHPLVPGQRVVQAWRFGSTHPDEWEPGVYSIVRFTMHAEGDATRFVIDHDAIPPQWEDHIQSGYSAFYQDPLTRHFGG